MPDARIVAVCIYYDETPRWLGEHLASLAPICSDFVYVDGAYALFPGAFRCPNSSPECAEAIHEMARACGRAVVHYRPGSPFIGNEVEKRNMSLDLARSIPGVAGDLNTWFLIADADTVAVRVNDALPRVLGETDRNVAEFGADNGDPLDPGDDEPPLGRWDLVHRAELNKPLHVRSLYRNLPGLRYGPAHWHVTHGLPGRDRSWLWGGHLRQCEPSLDLTMDLFFEHRRRKRQKGRNEAAARYYEARDLSGIENG